VAIFGGARSALALWRPDASSALDRQASAVIHIGWACASLVPPYDFLDQEEHHILGAIVLGGSFAVETLQRSENMD
jgi:hypothetical protein